MNKDLYIYDGVSEIELRAIKDRLMDFISLGSQDINNTKIYFDDRAKAIVKEGTLIHGTTYDEKKLESIAKSGIITYEFFGKKDSGGTYYHAEFYRANKEMSLKEFTSDARPFFPKKDNNIVGIMVVPSDEVKSIFLSDSLDPNSIIEDDVRRLCNSANIYHKEELENRSVAAIPIGVPANAFSAIVIGNKIKSSKTKVEFLKKTFPNLYIIDTTGKVLERPSGKNE